MKIAILKCNDCEKELNRTTPFEDKELRKIKMSSGFVAGKCPNGCRSTFSDFNLNTKLEVIEASNEHG